MSAVVIQKPPRGTRLDFGHRLARGLVGCWLLNEGVGSRVFDLSRRGNYGVLTNMDPATAWKGATRGVGPHLDGSDDKIGTQLQGFNPPLSAMVRCIPDTTQQAFATMVDASYYNGSNLEGFRIIYRVSETRFRANVGDTTSNSLLFCGLVGSGVLGVEHSFVLTHDGTTARLYQNGEFKDSAVQALVAPAVDVSLGWSNSNKTDSYFKGPIEQVMIYDRALSDNEIAALHRNPYAMFRR